MKKILIAFVLSFSLIGVMANAQTTTDEYVLKSELQARMQAIIDQVIVMLQERIAALEAQLAALIAAQQSASTPPVVEAQATSTPVVETPVATSTPVEPEPVPAPRFVSRLAVELKVNGVSADTVTVQEGSIVSLYWLATGESSRCFANFPLHGEVVSEEGNRSFIISNDFTFQVECVGNSSGTGVRKSVRVEVREEYGI